MVWLQYTKSHWYPLSGQVKKCIENSKSISYTYSCRMHCSFKLPNIAVITIRTRQRRNAFKQDIKLCLVPRFLNSLDTAVKIQFRRFRTFQFAGKNGWLLHVISINI